MTIEFVLGILCLCIGLLGLSLVISIRRLASEIRSLERHIQNWYNQNMHTLNQVNEQMNAKRYLD